MVFMRTATRYPKRSGAEWEAVRLKAAARFAQGERVCDVARALNASPQAVRVWRGDWMEGGAEALRSKGPRGRPRKLSAEQLKALAAEPLKGPRAQGYQTELWTLERIAKLIRRLFGVSYHPGHVFKVLRAMGWSCQRPTRRAKERDEAAIQAWLTQKWPRIKRGHNAPAQR